MVSNTSIQVIWDLEKFPSVSATKWISFHSWAHIFVCTYVLICPFWPQVCHATFCHSLGGERRVWQVIRWKTACSHLQNVRILDDCWWHVKGVPGHFYAWPAELVWWSSGSQASRCSDAWAGRSCSGGFHTPSTSSKKLLNLNLRGVRILITIGANHLTVTDFRFGSLEDFLVPALSSGTELSGPFYFPFRLFINICQWSCSRTNSRKTDQIQVFSSRGASSVRGDFQVPKGTCWNKYR